MDVRTDLQFDDVHIEGSICIPSFSSGFGSKLAWLADHDQEIIFIGRDDADGRRAAKLALSVGVRNVAGMLAGGMTNWRQERHPATQTERLAADDLLARLAREPLLQLLDVRERASGRRVTCRARCSRRGTTSRHPRGARSGPADSRDLRRRHAGATAASLLRLHGATA